MATKQEQLAFISNVAKAAMASQQKWGVPASITIAQAILESAWGGSTLTKRCNNYFGVKAKEGEQYAEFKTEEYFGSIGAPAKRVIAKFKVYPSPLEAFDAHGQLLASLNRYAPAMHKADDPLAFAIELQHCGYSTDPNYPSKLAQLMKRHDLTRFDSPLPTAKGQNA
jgi:flagellum-specific peptidoglycan hydrolase FlgJ